MLLPRASYKAPTPKNHSSVSWAIRKGCWHWASVHLGSHTDVPGHIANFSPLKILAWLRQHYLLIDTFPVELTG